jgi:hypothetical protein
MSLQRLLVGPLAAALLLGAAHPARADDKEPPLGPQPALFSQEEIDRYDEEAVKRHNRRVLLGGGALLVTLLATGVTLMAVGLGRKPGSAGLTTGGVVCLGLATVTGFTGLELIQW